MSQQIQRFFPVFSCLHSVLTVISRQMALIGGLIMMAIAIMVVVSILGRTFFNTSITGDYELVEMGLGIAIFLFLPYCHQKRGHVVVDFFTLNMSDRSLTILQIISDLLMGILAALISWRLVVGGEEAYDYMDYSMILQLPNWVIYVSGSISFGVLTLNCLDSLAMSVKELAHE